MKLLFSLIFVLVLIPFSLTTSVSANCLTPASGSCATGIACNSNPVTCCDTQGECDSFVEQLASNPLCGGGEGVNTAFGCLMAGNPKKLVSQLLSWGVSVGGGVAFLMILFAGFQMTTAAGDAKRVQAARELMVSAISGLILIVMSVFLLNFFGVNILGLSNLGFRVSL